MKLLKIGYSNRKIARILGRVPQTIHHAVNRGNGPYLLSNCKSITLKRIITSNIAIQLTPITKYIFVTDKTVDDVQIDYDAILLQIGRTLKCSIMVGHQIWLLDVQQKKLTQIKPPIYNQKQTPDR